MTARELDIRPAAPPDAGRPRPPLRARRAGLRRHLRERAGGAAHRLPVPPRQPPRRHRARHRRPVGAGARLVHLRRRRPDVALQRQCRRAEDADPAPDPLGHRLAASSTQAVSDTLDAILGTEISPELVPADARARRRRAPKPRSAPTSCRTSTSSTCSATASARPRSPSWRCTPGATRRGASGRPASRRSGAAPTTLAEIRRWLRGLPAALLRLQPVQALRHAERPEGRGRRLALAARRLARALGRQRERLAGGAAAQRAGGVSAAWLHPGRVFAVLRHATVRNSEGEMKDDGLQHGPLTESCAHLCVDMQNLFAEDTEWHTPWMERVLPVVERIARARPDRTIFTRFIPARAPRPGRGDVAPLLGALAVHDARSPAAGRRRPGRRRSPSWCRPPRCSTSASTRLGWSQGCTTGCARAAWTRW